jgi:hypothetical protein
MKVFRFLRATLAIVLVAPPLILWIISGASPIDYIVENYIGYFVFFLFWAICHRYIQDHQAPTKHPYISNNEWHDILKKILQETPILNEQSVDYDASVAKIYETLITTENGKPRYSIDPKVTWQNLLSVSKKINEKHHL